MAQQPGALGPLSRFMRFTTQREPVLSVGVLVALALYVATRIFPGLTDDDLQLLALIGLPIVTAVLARLRAYAPDTVGKATAAARRNGYDAGFEVGRQAGQYPNPEVRRRLAPVQLDPPNED